MRIPNRSMIPAVDQYAIEASKKDGDPVGVSDWTNYLKKNTNLFVAGQDLFGDGSGPQTVDRLPSALAVAKTNLAPVADDNFWSPYN